MITDKNCRYSSTVRTRIVFYLNAVSVKDTQLDFLVLLPSKILLLENVPTLLSTLSFTVANDSL